MTGLIALTLSLLAADLSTANRLYTEDRFQEAAAQQSQVLRERGAAFPSQDFARLPQPPLPEQL